MFRYSSVKWMNQMAMRLLLWQPQCVPVNGVGDRTRYFQQTHQVLWVLCPLLMSDFNLNWISLTEFSKILRCKLLWKSIWVSLFHVDGWMDGQASRHEKANTCFLQFLWMSLKIHHQHDKQKQVQNHLLQRQFTYKLINKKFWIELWYIYFPSNA
jgi:hypothetical protein